jgi:hypothetical protein
VTKYSMIGVRVHINPTHGYVALSTPPVSA